MRFNQFVLILFSLSFMVSVSAIEPQINVKVDNLLESGGFSSKNEAYKVSQSIGIKKNIYFVETAYHNRLNPDGFDGIVEIVEVNPKDASYGHIARSAVSELGLSKDAKFYSIVTKYSVNSFVEIKGEVVECNYRYSAATGTVVQRKLCVDGTVVGELNDSKLAKHKGAIVSLSATVKKMNVGCNLFAAIASPIECARMHVGFIQSIDTDTESVKYYKTELELE
jgi:hypothetical protein